MGMEGMPIRNSAVNNKESSVAKPPVTTEEVRSLIDKTRDAIGQKFFNYLANVAEKRTGYTEAGINPRQSSLPEYNVFQGLRSDLKGKLDDASSFQLRTTVDDEVISYQKQAEKLQITIRLENIKAYLALRRARKYATTPEDKARLEDLLARQNKVRQAFTQPELGNHLGTLKEYILKDMADLQDEDKMEGFDLELVRDATQSGLDTDFLIKIKEVRARAAKERVAKITAIDEAILKVIDNLEQLKTAA